MAAITICSDFGAQKNKVSFHCFPIYLPWSDGTGCHAKLAPKKGPGHCLVIYCMSNILQLSKSQWHHYIWEVCLANPWDAPKTAMPAAGTGQQKGLNSSPWQVWYHVAQPMLQKLKELDYEVLPHTPYSPDLSPTDYHFFKHLDSF